MEEVRAVLDRHEISYWVDNGIISIDGKPEVARINIGDAADASCVQEILDEA